MTADAVSTRLPSRWLPRFLIQLRHRISQALSAIQTSVAVLETAPAASLLPPTICGSRRPGELSCDLVVHHEAQGRSPRVRDRHHRAHARPRLPRSGLGELDDSGDCRRLGRCRAHLEELVLATEELAAPRGEAKTGRRRRGAQPADFRGYGCSLRRLGRLVPSAIRKGASSSHRGGSSEASRLAPPIVFEPLLARSSSGSTRANASSRLGR